MYFKRHSFIFRDQGVIQSSSQKFCMAADSNRFREPQPDIMWRESGCIIGIFPSNPAKCIREPCQRGERRSRRAKRVWRTAGEQGSQS